MRVVSSNSKQVCLGEKDRFATVPNFTTFEPSIEAFRAQGISITGDVNTGSILDRIEIEAPAGGEIKGGGPTLTIFNARGIPIAEYCTMPVRACGCSSNCVFALIPTSAH